ncbi:hypothetical protein [Acetobacter cerevisiae]|uniref:Uncharacterized protein n=1 Tax=Acetobacter cerevisiae TaxID=178900 RepID=A0A149VF12_9PROT|nr:hypothetical protein [Acetobacter cerevisiae]KXV78787.1 hypothetical protein AD954_01330 [Acetobacter cerevisiae]
MPTLTINGRDVEVGDEFLHLSPEQQNATVDEIAHSMGVHPAQADAPQMGAPGVVNGTGRAFATGVPILGGLADKLDAATNATLAPALNGLFSDKDQLHGDWSDRYRQALSAQNGADQGFATAHPVLNTGGQIAGSLAAGAALPVAGAGAGLLARAGTSAAQNAALGGLDSYTRGGNPWEGVTLGAGMGAGAGAISHFGRSDVLGSIARHLAGVGLGAAGGAAGAEMEGTDPLAAAMTGAATGAAGEAVGAAAKPVAAGARALEENAGANLTDRAFNARDVATQKVAQILANEGLNSGSLSEKLAQMGPRATLMDVSPTAVQAAGAIGAEPGRGQTVLRDFVQNRENASGGRVADMLTQAIGPRGDGDALVSALDNERRQAAGPLYESALTTPVQDSDELQSIMKTPAFRTALAKANTLASNEGRSLYAPTGESGMHGPVMAPDVANMTLQDLHYVQRAMQDNIGEIKAGAGFKDNELSRSIAGVRKDLLAQMDGMSPEYQQARKIYAGASRVRDSYDDGFKAFDSSTGENHLTNDMMERKLAGFESQSERQAYLLGARQRISNIMGASRNNRQRAYTLFGVGNDNPDFENQQKLATLLSYVRPAANQEAAQGAIQDDMRQRLGYSIAAPEAEPITPESVHGPDNPLVDAHGNALEPESEEGQAEIARRIAHAETEQQAAADLLAEQKQAALQFSGPDRARGQAAADALLNGLKTERQFGETKNEVSGDSKTARRLQGRQLIAASEVNLPSSVPTTVTRVASSLANAVVGSAMRRRADAVNYEMARLLAGSDTRLAAPSGPKKPNGKATPQPDPIAAALLRNPGIRERVDTKNSIAQALLTAAITQANMNGSR